MCTTGAALLAAGGSLYGGCAAHAAEPSYGSGPSYVSVTAPGSPSASPSEPDRAGSRAGEGRVRPGRSLEARPADEDGYADEDPGSGVNSDADSDEGSDVGSDAGSGVGEEPDGAVEPPRAAGFVPSASPQAAPAQEQPVGRMLRILPLGSGLLLIGLGCGLAFFGLRLRRG
ncbi:hypothetical protein ABZ330_20595 [Streptomyces sp. NPDC006172]|uniref:hypothetical protein n=1 Tax=Streptomyces sp. NPDC006172 TaxID=3154470 RepID=UPI0033CE21E4